jgi:hypothetical protein
LDAVIVASTIFALVTEASAILVVVTVPAAMVGFGYVPVRSPPAAPDAGNWLVLLLLQVLLRL